MVGKSTKVTNERIIVKQVHERRKTRQFLFMLTVFRQKVDSEQVSPFMNHYATIYSQAINYVGPSFVSEFRNTAADAEQRWAFT